MPVMMVMMLASCRMKVEFLIGIENIAKTF